MALRHSVGEFAATLVSMLRTRLELFSLEAGGQRDLLTRAIVKSLIGALLLILALLVLSLTIGLAFWSTAYRYHALVAMVLIYAAAGGWLLWSARQSLAMAPPPFSATLDALRGDMALFESLRTREDDDATEDDDDIGLAVQGEHDRGRA